MYFVFKHKLYPRAPRYPPPSSPTTNQPRFFRPGLNTQTCKSRNPKETRKPPCFSRVSLLCAPRALGLLISYHTTHTRAPTHTLHPNCRATPIRKKRTHTNFSKPHFFNLTMSHSICRPTICTFRTHNQANIPANPQFHPTFNTMSCTSTKPHHFSLRPQVL